MIEYVAILFLALVAGVILAALCFIIGAWVMFRGKSSPGEGFIMTPKGAVFSIPDARTAKDYPAEIPADEQSAFSEQSKRFLDVLLKGEK